MIDNLKPLGAFLENTIRPLIKETRDLVSDLDPIPYPDISKVLRRVFILQVFHIIMETIKTIACLAIIGFVVCKISR